MAAFAARYARAFAQAARTSGIDLIAAQGQLTGFAATLANSRELRDVLMNPSLATDQKLRVIDAIAERLNMTRPVRNFLAVIMDHQRLAEMDDILAEYAAVADTNAGVTEVEIFSARPLAEEERNHLLVKAGELANSRINASFREDASLLGGAVLKVGSTIYDGSLKAQLAIMKQRLSGAA